MPQVFSEHLHKVGCFEAKTTSKTKKLQFLHIK